MRWRSLSERKPIIGGEGGFDLDVWVVRSIAFIIGSARAGLCKLISLNSRNCERTRPTTPANIDWVSIRDRG
jgi:hypothetical protein